jgi:triosephosphate isomerase
MRTPFVAANWKMYKTVGETVAYFREFTGLVSAIEDVEIVVAPPFTAVHAAAEAARGSRVAIAGQDLYWEAEGAFTGQISAGMLREAGARLVVIGHSERRTKFGETDDQVNRKVKAAMAGGLTPIVCIGETLEQRERNETFEVLDRQIKAGLDGLSANQIAALAVAYEPVWAIGTGRNATAAQAQEAHAHIRGRLREWVGAEAGDACRILYGGSVKPANAKELVSQADVDGALVGGAGLDPKAFAEIVAASRPGRI